MTTQDKSCSFFSALTRSVAQHYLEGLDCPTSLGIFLCLRHGDDVSACSHSINPNQFEDADDCGRNYFAAHLLSKFREGPSDDHARLRAEMAVEKFWECEDHLRANYPHLDRVIHPSTCLSAEEDELQQVFYLAKEKIAKILGSVSAFDIDDCNFGPGSSSSVAGHKAHPSQKYIALDVTTGCRTFVENFLGEFYSPLAKKLVKRESSRICIVPKNFKSDRVIAIEPDWNIFFQKGFGAAIRKRLRSSGLDLNTAAAHHEQLCRIGSLTGDLVTIDLKSASDSISTQLVRFLLPDDWFFALNSVRTDSIEIKGTVHPIRKFSSMGNGFTFELESLIFYALSLSAKKVSGAVGTVSCFGDDIIAPKGCVPLLYKTLNRAGFRINADKSFIDGYFRESCGAHYFRGRNIKPFYLRENLSNDFEKFKVCNSIRLTAYRFYGRRYDDTPFCRAYDFCKRHIRRVFYIPAGYGDGGLISSFDEARGGTYRSKDRDIRRYPNCIEGYKVRCLMPVAVQGRSFHEGMIMYKLRSHELKSRDFWIDHPSKVVGQSSYLSVVFHVLDGRAICPDVVPQDGNSYMLRPENLAWRIGFMYIREWSDPELS